MHMQEGAREHVYTATRPIAGGYSPFVGGPQDDCVTSRAEVARPPVGCQRSRLVDALREKMCTVCVLCAWEARYRRGLDGWHGWRRRKLAGAKVVGAWGGSRGPLVLGWLESKKAGGSQILPLPATYQYLHNHILQQHQHPPPAHPNRARTTLPPSNHATTTSVHQSCHRPSRRPLHR